MLGFCMKKLSHILVKNLEVRKGCFISECTVLDLNCDRLRELQFGILYSYWSTLKLLPVLLFPWQKKQRILDHCFIPSLMSTTTQNFQMNIVSSHSSGGEQNFTHQMLSQASFLVSLVYVVKVFLQCQNLGLQFIRIRSWY